MSKDDDEPPVAGRGFPEKPPTGPKWSRRGRKMRCFLRIAWGGFAILMAILRAVRLVLGDF